jgi:cell division GTPase FtsZ
MHILEYYNAGRDVTRGLGAGGIPDNGRKAAEESRADLINLLQGMSNLAQSFVCIMYEYIQKYKFK